MLQHSMRFILFHSYDKYNMNISQYLQVFNYFFIIDFITFVIIVDDYQRMTIYTPINVWPSFRIVVI